MSSASKKAKQIDRILDSVPLLSSLSRQQKKQFAKELQPKIFNNNELLMKEGQEGDSFYIIISGKVDVSSKKGGHLAYLYAGDYAGEQALLKAQKRNATLKAIEKTQTLVCSKKSFDKIKKSVKFAKREGKRRAFALNHDNKNEIKSNQEINPTNKNQIDWILECVSDNLLFLKLDREQKEKVVKRMRLITVKNGENLIKQGDTNAQTFYVTESGSFDIYVDSVKVGEYKRGGCFGELALLYDSPRAATILATSVSKVWEVSRSVLRYEIQQAYKAKNASTLKFLKRVELFKPLLNNELMLISDALETVQYKKGDVILKEGEDGDKFYIIKKGQVLWSKKNGESGDLNKPQFFGERALRTKDKRAATITVKSDFAILYEMTSKDFNELLGPVIEIVDDKIATYKRMTQEFNQKQLLSKKLSSDDSNNNGNNKTKIKKKLGPLNDDDGDSKNTDDITNEVVIRDKVCKLNELKTIGVLGKGAFGLVSLVVDPKSNKSYALKAIKKCQIIDLGQQEHILSEKAVMEMMFNKFLVNLHTTYKDKLRVYFLLDVCLGGELFTILRQRRYFDENTAKFYTSCVVEAFAYMHKKYIIYRDLKPENLVLDSVGYLKVTDFGFAKKVTDKTFTLCGTPDYLAPEIVTGQGHGKGVDWWTLGILIYEMLASFPPFFDDEPMMTYRKIIQGKYKFPRYLSPQSKDIITKFLKPKPTKRLGVIRGNTKLIKSHPWFKDFKWDSLVQHKLKAPIRPKIKSQYDLSNFDHFQEKDEDLSYKGNPDLGWDKDF